MGCLEVTFFYLYVVYVRSQILRYSFFVRLNYGTPHMTIYGGPEVEYEGSTSAGQLLNTGNGYIGMTVQRTIFR